MDYKKNQLTKELTCDKILLEDFDTLRFGILGEQAVFDATAYCIASNIPPVSSVVFSRANKRFIEAMIDAQILERGKMFYTNTDGHDLIDAGLVFLYMAFATPQIFVYFDSIVREAISTGIAFSDGLVASLASSRIPSSVLEAIIGSRTPQDG